MASERRLHPLSFLFAIQETAKQFLVPAGVAIFAARGDSWEIWASIVVLPLALVALTRAWSVRYAFEETEFVMRSGFIFKRVRHIPYERVQNVDAVQNILHRAVGVMDVRIETGGGGETEAVLRVVDRAALDEIRAHVFAKRAAPAIVEGNTLEAAPATVLLTMPPRELLLFGLIHGKGMLVVATIFGLLWEFRLMDRVGEMTFDEGSAGRGVVRQLLLGIFGDAALPIWPLVVGVLGFMLVLLLFRVLSAFWTFLTYYGFTLSRTGDDLRCEYGLLTQVASTIPLHRIQEVVIREGPWHRWSNRVSVAVQTAGGTAADAVSTRRAWLAPLVHRADLPRLLDTVIAGAPHDPAWQGVQPRGARREFVRSFVFVVLPISVAAAVFLHWRGVWLFGLLVVWMAIHARRTVAAIRWTTSGGTVQFTSGWIWRKLLMAPLGKIQVVSRHESPFDRRHRMASVFVDTAGRAQIDYSIRIPYLSRPDADSLAAHLAASAAQTTFRW